MNFNQLAEGRCAECGAALEIRDDDGEQEPFGFCVECHSGWRLNTAIDGSMTVDYVLIPRLRAIKAQLASVTKPTPESESA